MSAPQSPSPFRALLSPDYLGRAMRALDRATLVIIGVVWLGAILMMGIAIYTAVKANKARQLTEEAAAVEPIVPQTLRAVVPRAELEKLAERLRGRFDKISFNAMPDNSLEITSSEAGLYLDWLAALSYLDTIAPQVRWAIRDLCVGTECGGALMRAAVSGERVTFKMPEAVKPESEVSGQKS
ncbi:MAG: hypothetical protein KBA75_08130 [Alphaproteobacteria bacterium]|nr:hypothetical protein [Alphaproteobacteria bacterium]